jgi:hypothetical protein
MVRVGYFASSRATKLLLDSIPTFFGAERQLPLKTRAELRLHIGPPSTCLIIFSLNQYYHMICDEETDEEPLAIGI